jgi:hypothetical protein
METVHHQSRRYMPEHIIWLCPIFVNHSFLGVELAPYIFRLLPYLIDYLVHCISVWQQQPAP